MFPKRQTKRERLAAIMAEIDTSQIRELPPECDMAEDITTSEIGVAAGQVEGLGDLLPADGSWDELPDPEPCPTCGGIDCWWGVWDERRCERCEPSGQRSLLLANRAARLRERTCQESARSIL